MVIIEEMNPNSNEFLVNNGGRSLVLDRKGQQVFKGGQTTDVGVLEAIPKCYSLLYYHPLAFLMLFLGVTILVAEYFNGPGPLEFAADALLHIVNDTAIHPVPRNAATVGVLILHKATDYKIIIAKLCLVWFTYVTKPSSRNMIYAVFISGCFLVMNMSYIKLLVSSQVFFLSACIRSTFVKYSLLIFLFIYLFTNWLDLAAVSSSLSTAHKNLSRKIP